MPWINVNPLAIAVCALVHNTCAADAATCRLAQTSWTAVAADNAIVLALTMANDAPSDTNPGTTQSATKLDTDVNADDNKLNAPSTVVDITLAIPDSINTKGLITTPNALNAPPTTVDITLATPDNIDTRGLITNMRPLNIGTSTFKVNFDNALNAVINVSNAPVFINASVNEFPVSAICCLNLPIFSTSTAFLIDFACSSAVWVNWSLVCPLHSAIALVSWSNIRVFTSKFWCRFSEYLDSSIAAFLAPSIAFVVSFSPLFNACPIPIKFCAVFGNMLLSLAASWVVTLPVKIISFTPALADSGTDKIIFWTFLRDSSSIVSILAWNCASLAKASTCFCLADLSSPVIFANESRSFRYAALLAASCWVDMFCNAPVRPKVPM